MENAALSIIGYLQSDAWATHSMGEEPREACLQQATMAVCQGAWTLLTGQRNPIAAYTASRSCVVRVRSDLNPPGQKWLWYGDV
eukprot:4617806-Amphidinium_carterae.1